MILVSSPTYPDPKQSNEMLHRFILSAIAALLVYVTAGVTITMHAPQGF